MCLSRPLGVVASVFISGCVAALSFAGTPSQVPKTNPKMVTMHYMPWFETPETLGGDDWGIHWEMANRDPNVIEPNGQRQIASHYYPLIGPYASSDPDVIEYHLLLMKLSGVDAVSIDWYGVAGSNGDIENLLTNSNALIDRVAEFGLEFNVVLEDRFARSIDDVKTNVAYLRDNYFNRPEYLRVGPNDDPLLKVFGPATVQDPAEWPEILALAGEDVELLSLWYRSNEIGASSDGEFAWIEENEALDDFLAVQQFFLQNHSVTLNTAVGTAFPGFDDYYDEGGLETSLPFEIPHNDGETLASTLRLLNEWFADDIDIVQLATWNDFGEGTMFEPTAEFGFDYLVQLQQFTGVPYGEEELQLVLDLYTARQTLAGDAAGQALLDDASMAINQLDFANAQALIQQATVPEPGSLVVLVALTAALGCRRREPNRLG